MPVDSPYGDCPRCGQQRIYLERSDVRLLAVDGEKVCAVQIDNEEFSSKTNNAWVECEAHLNLSERLAAFFRGGSSCRLAKRTEVSPGRYRVVLQYEWIVRQGDGESIEQAFMMAFDEIDHYMETEGRWVQIPSDLTRGRRGARERLRSV